MMSRQIQEDMEAASSYDITKRIRRTIVVLVLFLAAVGMILAFYHRSDRPLSYTKVTIVGYPAPAVGTCEWRTMYGPQGSTVGSWTALYCFNGSYWAVK